MATLLDLSLLKSVDVIFPFIFVFAILFAVLQNKKFISENVAINGIISIVAAFMVLLSDVLVNAINLMIPWFAILIIFILILLLVFQIFGASEKDIFGYIKRDRGVGGIIIGLVVAIVFGALAFALAPTFQELTEASFEDGAVTNQTGEAGVATSVFDVNLMGIIFNKKVLGLAIIFIIAVFAVGLLSMTSPGAGKK